MERKILLKAAKVFTVILIFGFFVFCVKVTGEEITKDKIDNASKKELIDMCQERGLPATGSATELRQIINDYIEKSGKKSEPTKEMVDDAGRDELISMCRERGLSATGSASELRQRMYDYLSKSDKSQKTEVNTGKKDEKGIDEGLILYYSFDEGKGDVVHDGSPGKRNGQMSDNFDVGECWVDGVKGKAIKFDGVGDVITTENDGIFNCPDGVTVEAWVKLDALPKIYGEIVRRDTGFELRLQAEGVPYFLITGPPPACRESYAEHKALIPGRWYHLVGTWDRATTKINLYVNGIKGIERNNSVIGTSKLTLDIGAFNYAQVSFFNGIIDEVRVYNRALTDKEVEEHYKSYTLSK